MGSTQSWFWAWVVGGSISPTSFHHPHQQGGLPSAAPLHDAASIKERSWFSCPPALRAESIHTSTTRASSAVLLRLGAEVIPLSATAGERQGQGSYYLWWVGRSLLFLSHTTLWQMSHRLNLSLSRSWGSSSVLPRAPLSQLSPLVSGVTYTVLPR